MFSRQVFLADIVQANTAGEARMSTLRDFAIGPYQAIGARSLSGQFAFPCVIDIAQARTLYVPGLDPQKLREAPFSGLYARREAKSIFFVPWEVGPINRPRVVADPIYVFSSGRCGSTLLHNILNEANVNSVSEPDIGAALLSRSYQKYRVVRPLLNWVTRVYVRDLMSALGSNDGGLVVKLRSQFCSVAHPMLKRSRERRTVFMTRQFENWAQSVGRLFLVTPDYLVREYRRSLKCYAYLRQHTNCHFIRYEDLVKQPHKKMAELARFLERDISRDAIDRAISVRSQAGTSLGRASAQGQARWDAMRDETYRRWKSSGTAELFDQIIGN
jgi:Sulfotransferase domain